MYRQPTFNYSKCTINYNYEDKTLISNGAHEKTPRLSTTKINKRKKMKIKEIQLYLILKRRKSTTTPSNSWVFNNNDALK